MAQFQLEKNQNKMEKISKEIISWLKNYAQNAKIKGFVVGISGGVDSAVVSTLCAETSLEVLCVELPIHQAENQVQRGRNHINFLKEKYPNVKSVCVDLTSTFTELENQFDAPTKTDLALANVRSRLRMTTLYYFAGINGYLVVGTGNKIEDFGVGFFTKYGDGGVDISPIADLTKTEVFALGKILGVSEEILRAKPTDGLFGDDRSDEDQLGASYPELEWAMQETENGKMPQDFSGRKAEVMQIYQRLNKINQHKMTPIPVFKRSV